MPADEASFRLRTYGVENVAAAFRSVSGALFNFRDKVNASDNVFVKFGNSIAIVLRRLARIRTGVFILATFFAVRPIINFISSLREVSLAIDDVFTSLGRRLDEAKLGIANALSPALDKLGEILLEKLLTALRSMAEFFSKNRIFIDAFTYAMDDLFDSLNITANAVGIAAISFHNLFLELKLADAQARRFVQGGTLDSLLTHGLASTLESLSANFRTLLGSSALSIDDLVKRLRHAADLTDAAGKDVTASIDQEVADLERRIIDGGNQVDNLFNRLKNNARGLFSVGESFRSFGNLLVTSLAEMAAFLERFQNRAKDAPAVAQSFLYGFARSLHELAKKTSADFGKEFADGVTKALDKGLGDTFFNIMKGKLDKLRDIVQAFADDISRALANLAAGQIVSKVALYAQKFFPSDVTGAPNGQTAPPTPSIPGPHAAAGFLASGTQRVTVGENGRREAIIPLSNGKVPVQLAGGGGGNVTLILAPQVIDAPSFDGWLDRRRETIYNLVSDGLGGKSARLRSAMKVNFGRR